MTIAITAAGLLVLLFLSAFFSSAETSLISLPRLKIRQMVKEKKPGAKQIETLTSDTDKLLTTILIGNNLVNNFASSLATALAISIAGSAGVGIATLIMTLFIIIFGEIAPKTIATYMPEKIARMVASPLLIIQKVMYPIVWVFSRIAKGVTSVANRIWKQQTAIITEEELKTMIDVGKQEGTLEEGEKEMLHRVFEFTDLKVREIMKPRMSISAISSNLTYNGVMEAFKKYKYSRLPVYTDTTDTIEGIIHYKDLLFYRETDGSFSVRKVMRPALFVPESKTSVSLLHTFRVTKQNIAFAVDEHGSVSGIVSMDDILKSVFGRITDEYDDTYLPPEQRVEIVNEKEFIVPGNLEIEDVNTMFHLRLESDYYHTIGGWLLEAFGYLPAAGDSLRNGTVYFTVEEQSGRRIQRIRLRTDIR